MKVSCISIAVLTFCMVNCASAQGFNAGLSLGIATTQVDGDGYGGFNKAGAIAGIWVDKNLNSAWNARMELRYIQKGSHEKDKNVNATIYKLKQNYFELPISATYTVDTKVGIIGGVAIGYLAAATEFDANGEIPVDVMVELRDFEISAFLGLNYSFTDKLLAETKISYSIIPICPNQPDIEHWRNYGPFNRCLEFVLLYKF